nr:LytR family transcriptional regulator [Propionibacterium sp.]
MSNSRRADEEPGRPPAPKRRRGPLRLLAGALAVILIAGAGLAGWYLLRANMALNAIPRVDFETVTPSPSGTDPLVPAPTPVATPEPARPAVAPVETGLNFLLLGTDYSGGGNSRSDSFMVLHVSADRSKIFVISYPRDSWVDIPGHGKGKINWAYQWGGVSLAKKTIEQLSGVGIDHTLHVDFDGFIALTDVVGGVTVDNPTAFSNGGYNFPAGPVTVSGEKALAYVRARYGLPRWDLSRAANQRAVVKAIIVKTLRPQVIGNPVTFDRLLTEAAQCITVDKGLTDDVVRALALSMKIDSNADIVLLQAPISGFDTLRNGDSIDVVDWKKMDALSQAIRTDTIGDYVAKYGTKGYNF